MTYPSGRMVTTEYDNGGRPKEITGTVGGPVIHYTYENTPIEYTAHGAVSSMKLGNGVVETATVAR